MCQWVIGMLINWPVIGQNSVNSGSDWPKLTHSPMSVTWLRSKYWNSDDAQSQECTMIFLFTKYFIPCLKFHNEEWKWNSSCKSMSGNWRLHIHTSNLNTKTFWKIFWKEIIMHLKVWKLIETIFSHIYVNWKNPSVWKAKIVKSDK